MSKIIAFRASDGLAAEIEGKSIVSGGTKTDVILEMLEGLGSIEVATGRKKLPEISGVYIVYVDKRLLYIGQTANLKNRFKTHHRLPEFVEANARVAWFGDDDCDRLALEGEMIDLLEPEMNRTPCKYDANKAMMASFRIDREVWAKFGAIAKRERLTVTDVLTGYIQSCVDNDRTEYGVSTNDVLEIVNTVVSTLSISTDKFNTAVMTAVSGLTDKLAALELEVESLKKVRLDRTVR